MEQVLVKSGFIHKIRYFLWFLLVLTIFFPVRYVFQGENAFILGIYSDFTSFSLYLSDITIIILTLTVFLPTWRDFKKNEALVGLVFILLALFMSKIERISPASFYYELRFAGLVLIYLLFFRIPLNIKLFLGLFTSLAALQSIWAFLQFIFQKSLGLWIIGESWLNPEILGVAKIVSHGTKFIRGYGTFPHPNLLAAFLFTAILFSFYLIFASSTKKLKIFYCALLVVNILGLFLTFSRAGLLTTGLSAAVFFIVLLFKKYSPKKTLSTILVSLMAGIIAITALHQFLFTRATISDQATIERKFYNQVGLDMIKDNLGQGTGLGMSILRMPDYSPLTLQPWEIQPIHNYYLIALAELGLIGGLALIGFILWHLYKLGRALIKTARETSENYLFLLVLFCILLGYLILMLFDHYFYTLHQTQLLLWLILGLIASRTWSSPTKKSPDQAGN